MLLHWLTVLEHWCASLPFNLVSNWLDSSSGQWIWDSPELRLPWSSKCLNSASKASGLSALGEETVLEADSLSSLKTVPCSWLPCIVSRTTARASAGFAAAHQTGILLTSHCQWVGLRSAFTCAESWVVQWALYFVSLGWKKSSLSVAWWLCCLSGTYCSGHLKI